MGNFKAFHEARMNEGFVDWLGRKLNVKTTKGKPSPDEAPRWAKYLVQVPVGAYYWLSNLPTFQTEDDYFFDVDEVKFSGYIGEVTKKPYVEKL